MSDNPVTPEPPKLSAGEKLSEATLVFVDLLRQSVIIQGTLTLILVVAWLYLIVTGRPVPVELNNILGLVVGFYFGGKVSLAIARQEGTIK